MHFHISQSHNSTRSTLLCADYCIYFCSKSDKLMINFLNIFLARSPRLFKEARQIQLLSTKAHREVGEKEMGFFMVNSDLSKILTTSFNINCRLSGVWCYFQHKISSWYSVSTVTCLTASLFLSRHFGICLSGTKKLSLKYIITVLHTFTVYIFCEHSFGFVILVE